MASSELRRLACDQIRHQINMSSDRISDALFAIKNEEPISRIETLLREALASSQVAYKWAAEAAKKDNEG